MENHDRNTARPVLADTHCHVIEGRDGYGDANAVFKRASDAGVARMLLAENTVPTSALAVATAEKYALLGYLPPWGSIPTTPPPYPPAPWRGRAFPGSLRTWPRPPGGRHRRNGS